MSLFVLILEVNVLYKSLLCRLCFHRPLTDRFSDYSTFPFPAYVQFYFGTLHFLMIPCFHSSLIAFISLKAWLLQGFTPCTQTVLNSCHLQFICHSVMMAVWHRGQMKCRLRLGHAWEVESLLAIPCEKSVFTHLFDCTYVRWHCFVLCMSYYGCILPSQPICVFL